MEFVEVNHVELPNETWDSYESSELYDYLDNTQIHGESMATSTTRTAKRKHVNGMKLHDHYQYSNQLKLLLNSSIKIEK